MKKNEFIDAVKGLVYIYINNKDGYGPQAQLRVNPVLLTVDLETAKEFQDELEDSDEAIENAAYAFGGETEEASDYQAAQNPDFYPVETLIKDGAPDMEAIEKVAANYF